MYGRLFIANPDLVERFRLDAGINMLWRASEWSIRQSVQNAMALAADKGVHVYCVSSDWGRFGRIQLRSGQGDHGG